MRRLCFNCTFPTAFGTLRLFRFYLQRRFRRRKARSFRSCIWTRLEEARMRFAFRAENGLSKFGQRSITKGNEWYIMKRSMGFGRALTCARRGPPYWIFSRHLPSFRASRDSLRMFWPRARDRQLFPPITPAKLPSNDPSSTKLSLLIQPFSEKWPRCDRHGIQTEFLSLFLCMV